jgi:hypothetical protein
VSPRRAAVAAGVAILLGAAPAWAHGFGQRYDLPVPLWLWVAGAAAAVALSFVVTGLVSTAPPGPARYPTVNLLRWRLGRALVHPWLWHLARALAIAALLLVVIAGALGSQNPNRNLAPTAVWVLWWVGVAYLSALVGDVWAIVNPWAALFAATEPAPEAGNDRAPAWLGAWPAVVLFLAFAWIELVWPGRAEPAQLALLTLGYTLVAGAGMVALGRSRWLRRGDPFAVAFSTLARFAPTELRVRDRAICATCPARCASEAGCVNCVACFTRAPDEARALNLRPFGAGLLDGGVVSTSMVAFVLVLLSSVTFDGFTATPAWAAIESVAYAALPPLGGQRLAVIGTLGLLGFALLFALLYAAFARWMARAGGQPASGTAVARAFVVSLIPIAVAYHLAHYLTYLLVQGQRIIPLASDPLGLGWDLLGTAGYVPDIGIVGARFAWYTAVIAIVSGHIAAVFVAHAIALRQFGSRQRALRSQYAMLLLMVGYTVASLWIIAQPIVESSPAGS